MSTPKPAGGYHSGGFIPPASTTIHIPPKFADTPTHIDPADIRPGDTFRLTHEATCEQIDKRTGDIVSTLGDVFAPVTVEGMSWHLVSRPDPDAEAVDALILAASTGSDGEPDYDNTTPEKILARLREQGWDVVRRAES